MKKNFLISVALAVVAFFVATEIAVAADVSFSGQIRTRLESNGQSNSGTPQLGGFSDTGNDDDFIATRVRLNANVSVNDSTSAFIQMQSSRVWGECLNAAANCGTAANGVGSGSASFTPSDADASVGIHEAYFTLKNFATLPADLKLGRQQVVIDGHRLFGHTGWTTGAQTHDAIRLTHKGGNHTLSYVYILANETDRVNDAFDADDVDVHLLHANFQGILGGGLSLYFVANVDECGDTGNCSNTANDVFTVGFRQAGQLFGLNYRGEYYHQWGDARADATATGMGHAPVGDLDNVDRDAYMFGVRIGKKFNNVQMKPSITFWYDELSGTDTGDVASGDWSTFNTLFDTGHKFYGFMDLFLNNVNHGTAGLGLHDAAIKASLNPLPGWTIKADWHWFETDEVTATTEAINPGTAGDELGQEVDLTLVHKYNANTKIVFGYSVFTAEQLFNDLNTVDDDAEWAYVMFDVKF